MEFVGNKKYIIRGTKEGLWFEVVEIGDGDDINELVAGGEVVAEFEIDFSNERKQFVLKKILFKKELSREEKVLILDNVKDFVASLNVQE